MAFIGLETVRKQVTDSTFYEVCTLNNGCLCAF